MKLSEKLQLLDRAGIIDWFDSHPGHEGVETLVNALGEYIFDGEDMAYINFTPGCWNDAIYFHFVESGYDNSWYEQISGNFSKLIKECIGEIVFQINYHNIVDMSDQELETYVIAWVEEWGANCRKAFQEQLSKFD